MEATTDDVTTIRNDAEQTAYDKSLHPGLDERMERRSQRGFLRRPRK